MPNKLLLENTINGDSSNDDFWEPLECTPECLNALLVALGVHEWEFIDVLDTSCLPYHAAAFLLLHPTTKAVETYIQQMGTVNNAPASTNDLLFIRQHIGGSCGSIAVLHALLNSCKVKLPVLDSLRAVLVPKKQDDDQDNTIASINRSRHSVESIQAAHAGAAATIRSKGLSSRAGQRQGQHFVTFIQNNNDVWLLDGRREGPICRVDSSVQAELRGLLDSSAKEQPQTIYRFSVMALVASTYLNNN